MSSITYYNQESENFVKLHPEVLDFISKAQPTLNECFGRDVDITIELMHFECGDDDLVGWIHSKEDVDLELDRKDKFDELWYLDHMDDLDIRFNFNLNLW